MVGILLNSYSPKKSVRISYVAKSESLTEDKVLRQAQTAFGYKFSIGLDVAKEPNGNSSEPVSDAQVAS
jgi:hypothetical protein